MFAQCFDNIVAQDRLSQFNGLCSVVIQPAGIQLRSRGFIKEEQGCTRVLLRRQMGDPDETGKDERDRNGSRYELVQQRKRNQSSHDVSGMHGRLALHSLSARPRACSRGLAAATTTE